MDSHKAQACGFLGMICFGLSFILPCETADAKNCQAPGPLPPNVETASWYGKKHHGLKTANGEPFNKNEMTAAHPTLPLGSYLKVTNLANGRFVYVKVTDRESGASSDIDLSEAAARALGMKGCGIAHVIVTAEKPPAEKSSNSKKTH